MRLWQQKKSLKSKPINCSKGKFSKEDFKDLLEVYEDRTEKTEG